MAVLDRTTLALDRVRDMSSEVRIGNRWRPSAAWAGPMVTLALAVALELLRGKGLRLPDPAAVFLLPVAASALLGGLRVGLLAGGIAAAASLVTLADRPFVTMPDNSLRALETLVFLPATAALVGWARDRLIADRRELHERRRFAQGLRAFGNAIGRESRDSIYVTVVERLPAVVACDLVALTLADPRDGRHFVRAVHGADPSLVGVEILPGVGVAGQAIRDRRVVVAERRQPAASATTDGPASTVAAIPIVTDGRVRATLTLGRTSDVRPFDAVEQQELEAVADVVGAVLGNVELRSELSESALRDPLTGLYNRTYLDAALDQLLALRRRMKSEDRRPMAVILFDLDGFRRFNEDHGREMGDQALHAVGGVVRRRFRVSDTMARIGGDGFLVVMDGASREDAAKAASDVRSRVRGLGLATSRGEAVRISVSAGCATFVEADPGAQAVIRTVEAALDTARWSGKDAIVSI